MLNVDQKWEKTIILNKKYKTMEYPIYITDYTYVEEAQVNRPVCYVPSTCTLTLSGETVITAPTVRGASDGSIKAAFTSTSGSTATWYINGVSKGVHASPYTFTGLSAGNYVITIEQLVCSDQSGTIIVPEGEFRTGAFYVSVPQAVSAVENPIMLELQTAVSSINPKYSINTLTVSGTITAAKLEFALTYPQIYNAEFLSKGYPDRSNYFLNSVLTDSVGTPKGTNSNTEIATSLAEALQQDSVISRLYYITNSGTTVTLKAKEYGDMYDLTASNLTVSGGVALANTQSGVVRYDGQLAADYSVYVELFVDPNLQFGANASTGDFKRVAELELPFNNNNLMQFDLATVLKNFVSSPKIDFTFTGFTTLGNMDTCYFCKYGEKYPLIENTNTKKKRYKGQTNTLYAINSALNFEDPNDMSSYLGTEVPVYLSQSYYTGVTFMNTAPNPKYIQRGSKEWLYFLLKTGYPKYLKLKGDIYYYNGTSQTGITFITITSNSNPVNFGGVTILAAGYDELGLAAYENSGNTKIKRVDFAVWQQYPTGGTSMKLTETRSYLLEIDEQPQKFNVAFLNKLGTYETFSFVGEVVEDQEVLRQTYQAPYIVNSVGAANDGFIYNGVYDTSYTKLWTVNSGTVDADTYYYLMELLASNKIYNYSNPHENFLTVVQQIAQKSSNQAEYTVQVQFKETIFENNVEK